MQRRLCRAYIMQRGFSTRKFLDIIQPWLYAVQGAAINEDMRARKISRHNTAVVVRCSGR